MARVLIFSGLPQYSTALGCIRSLGEAGHDVSLLLPERHGLLTSRSNPATVSKYLRHLCTYDPKNGLEWLEKIKEVAAQDKNLLYVFPVTDSFAVMLDEAASDLEGIEYPGKNGLPGSLVDCMDKHFQAQVAEECGLDVPQCVAVNPASFSIDELSDILFPCFCKAAGRFHGGNKRVMLKCDTFDQLVAHLDANKNMGCNMIIEQYVDIKLELAIPGVAYRGNVSVPCVLEETHMASGREAGTCMAGAIVSAEKYPVAVEGVKRFMRYLNYSGPFAFDFFVSGDHVYFGEVNLRSGGHMYAITQTGANLPAAYVAANEGDMLAIERCASARFGSYRNDKALWEEFNEERMSKSAYKSLCKYADFPLIESTDDAAPWQTFLQRKKDDARRFKLLKIKRFISKKLRRR